MGSGSQSIVSRSALDLLLCERQIMISSSSDTALYAHTVRQTPSTMHRRRKDLMYEVEYDGVRGYIMEKYLQLNE